MYGNQCVCVCVCRTSADLLWEGASVELKVAYLEEELRLYKLQRCVPAPQDVLLFYPPPSSAHQALLSSSCRYSTTDAQLAVAKRLLHLYSSLPGHRCDAARMMVELGSLTHQAGGHLATSLRHLEQATELLKGCEGEGDGGCVRMDQLGAAHLWKAVFLHEMRVR